MPANYRYRITTYGTGAEQKWRVEFQRTDENSDRWLHSLPSDSLEQATRTMQHMIEQDEEWAVVATDPRRI